MSEVALPPTLHPCLVLLRLVLVYWPYPEWVLENDAPTAYGSRAERVIFFAGFSRAARRFLKSLSRFVKRCRAK